MGKELICKDPYHIRQCFNCPFKKNAIIKYGISDIKNCPRKAFKKKALRWILNRLP